MTQEIKSEIEEKTKKKTLDITTGNIQIRQIEALFSINTNIFLLMKNLGRIADTLNSLNTKAELYLADCHKENKNG